MIAPSPVKLKFIAGDQRPGPGREGLRQLAARYLAARGLRGGAKSFFSAEREKNEIATMKDWGAWMGALAGARDRGGGVLLIGDYDVDGLAATSILHEALEAAGMKVACFVPDRLKDAYGLTIDNLLKAEAMVGRIPDLVATVDCGSAGGEAGEWLRAQGKKLIVLDHHDISPGNDLDCAAHLNPKADEGCADDLRHACAGALALWAVEELARSWGLENWWKGRQDALRLAGAVATICDVMPMRAANRALVKTALKSASDVGHVGLAALAEAGGMKEWNVESVGFRLGPALNALGRMGYAASGLALMMSRNRAEATLRAAEAVEANRLRKAAVERAMEVSMGTWQLPPQSGCIVTASESYHIGVAGIVAARLAEEHRVPALVLAKAQGLWKGSGRSVEGVDLGDSMRRAVEQGYLQSGGGHGAAVGLRLTDEKLEHFCRWMAQEAAVWQRPSVGPREIEVVGDLDWFDLTDWDLFYSSMEPFGEGNARPRLVCRVQSAEMARPVKTKAEGRVWAWKSSARTEGGQWIEILTRGPECPAEIPAGGQVVGVPSWWSPPGRPAKLTLTLDEA